MNRIFSKVTLYSLLVSLFVLTNSSLGANRGLEIRGAIKCASSIYDVPQLRILYDGKETISNREGFFSFPVDEKNIEKYSLILCDDVQQNFDKKNTLKHVSVIRQRPYRYFTFKKGPFGGSWQQKEKTLNKKNFVIPQHAVIVLVDPSNVESVQNWDIDLSNNILKLPVIVLKNDSLHKVSAHSLLKSLDKTVFCESVREESRCDKANPKAVISRVQ